MNPTGGEKRERCDEKISTLELQWWNIKFKQTVESYIYS